MKHLPEDAMNGDRPQPHCPLCGRFATRAPEGHWYFDCDDWSDGHNERDTP